MNRVRVVSRGRTVVCVVKIVSMMVEVIERVSKSVAVTVKGIGGRVVNSVIVTKAGGAMTVSTCSRVKEIKSGGALTTEVTVCNSVTGSSTTSVT